MIEIKNLVILQCFNAAFKKKGSAILASCSALCYDMLFLLGLEFRLILFFSCIETFLGRFQIENVIEACTLHYASVFGKLIFFNKINVFNKELLTCLKGFVILFTD